MADGERRLGVELGGDDDELRRGRDIGDDAAVALAREAVGRLRAVPPP